MAVPGANPALIDVGPGYIYWAPIGSAEPASTVVASVFSDAITTPWLPLGYTEEGCEFSEDITTAEIAVAEEFYPISTYTTAKAAKFNFALSQYSLTNLKLALNGGTITTTGATTTAKNVFDPVSPGSEVRMMLLWTNEVGDERAIYRKCFNTATISLQSRKAPANKILAFQMTLEKPATLAPYQFITAGTVRA